MKVGKLISQLSKLPSNIEVVMSKDGEGNYFSPLSDWTKGRYLPDSTYSGDFTDNEIDIKERGTDDSIEAICLWPIN